MDWKIFRLIKNYSKQWNWKYSYLLLNPFLSYLPHFHISNLSHFTAFIGAALIRGKGRRLLEEIRYLGLYYFSGESKHQLISRSLKPPNVEASFLRRIFQPDWGGGSTLCITANGNILAGGSLCFRVFNLKLKVINKNFCYLYSVWVN